MKVGNQGITTGFLLCGLSTMAQVEMSRTPGDLIRASLEDLNQYDFKRFKDKLSDFSYQGRRPIPRGHLENADYVATKNRLIDVYGEEMALDVTIQVFKLISLMGPADDLQKSIKGNRLDIRKRSMEDRLEDCRIEYRKHVKNKYNVFEDGNARLGETIHLKTRYTRLLLIKKHRNEEEREHEILSSGSRHLQIMDQRSSDEYYPTNIHSLFDAVEDGSVPKFVVLQGPAGIGKTMTSQKIMLDWATENLYQDKFTFVFYMSCRELNTINGNTSLAGLICKLCKLNCDQDLLHTILSDSEKLLFIIDGFDELKLSSKKDVKVCEDPFKETAKDILLNSLFRGDVLEEASVVLTTRPYSLMRLKELVTCPQYVEILGFTKNDREEYFDNFFETKEQAELALSIIKDNDTLFTLCVVPITCWIVCTVMKQQMAEEIIVNYCKTSTSIYLLYLKSLLKYHGRNSNQSISTCIRKLCALANEGIWLNKILFEEEDITRHGLSISELESIFLNENIFQRDIETQTCYSFIHLSVQEFFAALYYVLVDKPNNCITFIVMEQILFLKTRKVRRLLQESRHKPHLTLTVQFLFGFSSGKQVQETERCLESNISLRDRSVLEEWLEKPQDYCQYLSLNCLYETQDDDLVGRIMSQYFHVEINKSLDFCSSYISYRALSYCLVNSRRKHKITLYNCVIGSKARAVLSPALLKCSKIRFEGCSFPRKTENKESLQPDPSISGLFTSHCGIQELELRSCGLTSSCCDDLCSIIFLNRSLSKLDVTENKLKDSGVKLLCKGIRHPGWNLKELRMDGCDLSSSCCDDLSSVIATNRTLIKLVLSWNNIKDFGVKLLCEGLKHPGCTLQELELKRCGLTSSCCDDLHSVIMTNRSLIRLDLTHNDLQDSGVKLLCEGLRNPCCSLHHLWVSDGVKIRILKSMKTRGRSLLKRFSSTD